MGIWLTGKLGRAWVDGVVGGILPGLVRLDLGIGGGLVGGVASGCEMKLFLFLWSS